MNYHVFLGAVLLLLWANCQVEAKKDTYMPFVASITHLGKNHKNNTFCTGSIIGERYILTAAHCYYNLFKGTRMESKVDDPKTRKTVLKTIVVNVGTIYRFGGKTHKIEEIFLRPKNNLDVYDDIMIIKLQTPMDLTHVHTKIIKLAKNIKPVPGMTVGIAGFGNHTMDGKHFSVPKTYTYGETKVRPDSYCNIHNDREFCAGGKNQGTMVGDSGGPIYYKIGDQKYQLGVVARGDTETEDVDDKKADLTDHGVYTKVSSYCDFIQEVTENDVVCEFVPGF